MSCINGWFIALSLRIAVGQSLKEKLLACLVDNEGVIVTNDCTNTSENYGSIVLAHTLSQRFLVFHFVCCCFFHLCLWCLIGRQYKRVTEAQCFDAKTTRDCVSEQLFYVSDKKVVNGSLEFEYFGKKLCSCLCSAKWLMWLFAM